MPDPDRKDQIMTKLTITPFDAQGNAIARGKTSIASDATQAELDAKVAYSAKRAGKKVARINVNGQVAGVDNTFVYTIEDGQPALFTKPPSAPNEQEVVKEAPKTRAVGTEDHRRGQKAPIKPVILTLLETLEAPQTPEGWTVTELATILAKATGRDPEGLQATISTQLSRLRSDGHKVIRASSPDGSRYKVVK